jgi:hypothetical protein
MNQEAGSDFAGTLDAPAPRTHVHTRSVEYRGYHREDGLWDIEAVLTDKRAYAHETPDKRPRHAGEPVHGMVIRLTVDNHLKITGVAVGMPATPFPECQQAKPPMQRFIGRTLGREWRKTIAEALGGTQGCAHLRELLFNMATVGFQTVPQYSRRLRQLAGKPEPELKRPPPFVDQCIAWDSSGPVLKRTWPQFANDKSKEG